MNNGATIKSTQARAQVSLGSWNHLVMWGTEVGYLPQFDAGVRTSVTWNITPPSYKRPAASLETLLLLKTRSSTCTHRPSRQESRRRAYLTSSVNFWQCDHHPASYDPEDALPWIVGDMTTTTTVLMKRFKALTRRFEGLKMLESRLEYSDLTSYKIGPRLFLSCTGPSLPDNTKPYSNNLLGIRLYNLSYQTWIV